MNWLLTVLATVVVYTAFSYFGMRTGSASTLRGAMLAPFTDLVNLALVMIGSAGFGVAAYYGAKSSPVAVTVIIALGVVVSLAFSALFADTELTARRLGGIGTVLIAVWLLK